MDKEVLPKNRPNNFSGDEILRHMPEWYSADNFHFSEETDSTNSRLKELANTGSPEFTTFVADRQTGGRGRLGRSFFSPPGCGIYLSILLKPETDLTQIGVLTAFSAVVVCDAIEKVTGLTAEIKWVNDIVIGGRKICGILTEMSTDSETGKAKYVIVGCGINVNSPDGGFPYEIKDVAGTLSQFSGTNIGRAKLTAEIISGLAVMSRDFSSCREEYVKKYRRRCITLDKDIRVSYGDSVFTAKAVDIDDSCGLIVLLPDGSSKTITYGEVSVRGLYGYSE